MTKKDYVLIAKTLADTDAPANTVRAMAEALAAQHKGTGTYAFQTENFVKAATSSNPFTF
jgi:hypothetical protein